MKRLDFIGGIFWFIFSVFAAFESYHLRLGNLHRPGSGFLPFVAASTLGLLSMVICFRSLIHREDLGDEDLWPNIKGWPNVVIVLLILFGYILIMEKLGFIITTFLFLFLLLKSIEPQSWGKTIAFSCFGSFFSYLLFKTWLKIPLPLGILNQLGF